MAMGDDDRRLDARLRDVPVPAKTVRALSAEAVFDDACIDQLLAEVSPPQDLIRRLRVALAAPSPRRGAIDLDRVELGHRASAMRPGPMARRLLMLAKDAAAVATALAVAWAMFAGGAAVSRRLAAPPRAEIAAAAERSMPRSEPSVLAASPQPPAAVTAPLAVTAPPPRAIAPVTEAPVDPLPAVASRALESTARTEAPPVVRGAAVGTGGDHDGGPAATPGVRLVEPPRDAWRAVPRVRGFDIAFEMAHGESPFADPGVPGLAGDVPPLNLRTDTFDRFVRQPPRRQRPQTRVLRMEDVLAAIPAAAASSGPRAAAGGGMRLEVGGVRSLRSVRGAPSLIVEVAATAESLRGREQPPLDAVVVIDRSVGCDPLVWPWLCRGLAAVAARMGSQDRITLVVGGPVPRLAVRRGDAAAIAAVATELERLPPTDVADIDAALRLAATEAAGSRRLVVLAQRETAEHGRTETRLALSGWHETLAGSGGERSDGTAREAAVRFVLVDPAEEADGRGDAATFGGTPADATSIRRAALRQVFVADTLVARQCRLAVTFDPRHVSAYRLVGHRQSAMESLASAPTATIDLHAGETVRAVYEVVPRGRPADAAVSAAVEWRSPEGTASRRLTAALDADTPDLTATLPSPHGCELLLAVALAETAGGSAHADPRAAVAAAALAGRWQERGDVTDFGVAVTGALDRSPAGRRPSR